MKYIFEVSESEDVRLRILNEDGSVAREVPRVLRMAEACRRLGRSRRHLYRYVARGWFKPVAKFSGELFFDAADLKAYRRGPSVRRPSLPAKMAPLFPDYDVRSLQPDRDADLILSRILERGRTKEIRWALGRYPLARRRIFLKTQGQRLLSDRAFHFWQWLWGGTPVRGRSSWRIAGRPLGGIA